MLGWDPTDKLGHDPCLQAVWAGRRRTLVCSVLPYLSLTGQEPLWGRQSPGTSSSLHTWVKRLQQPPGSSSKEELRAGRLNAKAGRQGETKMAKRHLRAFDCRVLEPETLRAGRGLSPHDTPSGEPAHSPLSQQSTLPLDWTASKLVRRRRQTGFLQHPPSGPHPSQQSCTA